MKVQNALTLALAAATVFLFAKTKNLENEIGDLRSSVSGNTTHIESRINSIYTNVDNMLEEQASLFSEVSYEFNNFTKENNSALLYIRVMPKTVFDGMTAKVTLDGKSYEMEKSENNLLSAKIPVDIFKYYKEKPLISIISGGMTQNEYLNDIRIYGIWDKFLPHLEHAELSMRKATYKPRTVDVAGTISLRHSDCNSATGIGFENYALITEINGVQTEYEDITEKVENSADPVQKICHIAFNEEYELYANDVLTLYIAATDSAGYLHKKEIYSEVYKGDSRKPEYQAAYPANFNGEYIYSSDGKNLYGEEVFDK